MRLRLSLLLLLLVIHYSHSHKVDKDRKVDDTLLKRLTNANLVKESFIKNFQRNLIYFFPGNKEKREKETLRGSKGENFGEMIPSQKIGTCKNWSNCKCGKTKQGYTISNNSRSLTKMLLSDPRYEEIFKSQRDLSFLMTWLMNRKQSIVEKQEKSDRNGKKHRKTKLRTVSGNELAGKVIVMNQLRENTLSSIRKKPNLKTSHEDETSVKMRAKRQAEKLWIEKNVTGYDDSLNMHAFIVRDEEIPPCGNSASPYAELRYFMCSGAILTSKHVLTTASCIHFAHIYEHHINALLSVLIGAGSSSSYVLNVRKYEMHPSYESNEDAKNYALHNLAIVTLICHVPSHALFIPKMPSKYEDVGHVCCSNRCKLFTVVQTPRNKHKIQLMDAKHIPSAMHSHEKLASGNVLRRKRRETVSFVRKIKRKAKKIAPPVFFNNEATKNRLKTGSSSKRYSDKLVFLENDNNNGNLDELSQQIMQVLFRSNLGNDSTAPSSNISDAHQKIIDNFIKDISEKAVERVNKILRTEEQKNNNASIRNTTGVDLLDDIANTLMNNIISNLNLTGIDPISIVSDSLVDPSTKYYNCPPLGSPIILNKTLVMLPFLIYLLIIFLVFIHTN